MRQRVVSGEAACGAAQCLAVGIDVSSTATSEHVTISSVELDGQTHSLTQPISVSITQTAEAAHRCTTRGMWLRSSAVRGVRLG